MTELVKIEQSVIDKLNSTVISVISMDGMNGFEKAFKIAQATADLRAALTEDYMKPIMALQGSKLGFLTDKDDENGYKMDVVRDCLIEAVLTGVQPFGNQFNIISSKCYVTKEGFGHLLSKVEYDITPMLPRINTERTSAAIVMKCEWVDHKGIKHTKEIDYPIRMNKGMGTDAVIGKAIRKARAYIFSKISGIEIGEGDVRDGESIVVSSKITGKSKEEIEADRFRYMIDDCASLADLEKIASQIPDSLLDLYTVKKDELSVKK